MNNVTTDSIRDRYHNQIKIGDVITINGSKNPFKDESRIFKVEDIAKSISGKLYVIVDDIHEMLGSSDIELYAKKYEE